MMRNFNERITLKFYNTLRGILSCRDDHFLFDLVFIKKNNQIEIKKITQTRLKPVQTSLTRFSRFGSSFFRFGFGSIFSVSGL
jgi:hypothetical protein